MPDVDAEELEEIRDQVLLGANLLKRVDQGMYQLHQLLREFFASKREQRADAEELQRKFYQVVIAEAERVRDKPERSFIKESTVMVAHLQAAIRRLERQERALDVATCLNWIAELYRSQGRYEEAEPLYVRALSIREQQLGQDHPDVAESLNNLASLYESQGRYEEAELLYVRALSIWEQQLGQDHPDVAISLNNLARLYRSQAHYNDAEPLFLKSLCILQNQLSIEHPLTARISSNLAYLYDLQGRYREAESLYLQSLPILFAKLQESHNHRQEATKNFRSLLEKAIQEHRTDELSDDPMTRSLLQEL